MSDGHARYGVHAMRHGWVHNGYTNVYRNGVHVHDFVVLTVYVCLDL